MVMIMTAGSMRPLLSMGVVMPPHHILVILVTMKIHLHRFVLQTQSTTIAKKMSRQAQTRRQSRRKRENRFAILFLFCYGWIMREAGGIGLDWYIFKTSWSTTASNSRFRVSRVPRPNVPTVWSRTRSLLLQGLFPIAPLLQVMYCFNSLPHTISPDSWMERYSLSTYISIRPGPFTFCRTWVWTMSEPFFEFQASWRDRHSH